MTVCGGCEQMMRLDRDKVALRRMKGEALAAYGAMREIAPELQALQAGTVQTAILLVST